MTIFQWTADIMEAISNGYAGLLKEFVPIFVAIIIATIGGSLIGLYISHRGKQYFFSPDANKNMHYIWMALIVGIALVQDYDYSPLGIATIVIVAVLGVLSIFFLIKWRKIGVYTSIAYTWTVLVISRLSTLKAIPIDYANISSYDVPSQFSIYQADRVVVMLIVARAIMACAITIMLVMYYGKRHLLFVEERNTYKDINVCPACGRPVTSAFCPHCGRDLRDYSKSILNFEPLDTKRHCEECGSLLSNTTKECLECTREKWDELSEEDVLDEIKKGFAQGLKKKGKDTIKSKVKGIVVYALILVFFFLPYRYTDALSAMVKGSAAIYNNYIGMVLEYNDNPNVSYDDVWMEEYLLAHDTLFEKNASGFYGAKPDALKITNAYAYFQYLPQSYYQNCIMESIKNEITMHSTNNLISYFNALDSTIDKQVEILSPSNMGMFSSEYIKKVRNMLSDSIRFYVAIITIPVMSITLIAFGIIGIIVAVYLFLKRGIKHPFLRVAYTQSNSEMAEIEGPTYRKKQRRILIASVLVIIAILAFGLIANRWFGKPEAISYRTAIQSSYYQSGAEMVEWLGLAKSNPELALSKTDEFAKAVQNWKDMQEILLLPENQEEANKHPEIKELNEIINAELAEIEAALSEERIPGAELITETMHNIVKGMNEILPSMFMELYSSVGDIIK